MESGIDTKGYPKAKIDVFQVKKEKKPTVQKIIVPTKL